MITATLVTAASGVQAQRPSLAGTWKIEPAAASGTGGGAGGGNGRGNSRGGGLGLGPSAETLMIQQTAAAVTVEERFPATTNRLVYSLDAKPTTNSVGAGRGRGATKVSFQSSMKDGKLVATFSLPPVAGEAGSRPRRYEQTYAIEPDGSLVVETREVGAPNTRRVVYHKSPGATVTGPVTAQQ